MFNKDILLIDLETTGIDFQEYEILQLAAVLLDKKTLKEKKKYNFFIRPEKLHNWDPESNKTHGITKAMAAKGLPLLAAIKRFNQTFSKNVVLAYYVGPLDINFLQAAYKKVGLKFPFDYHMFDLWGLFYFYCAKNKILSSKEKFPGFGLDSLMKHFGITSPPRHDALVDCRVEAEILRRIIKSFT